MGRFTDAHVLASLGILAVAAAACGQSTPSATPPQPAATLVAQVTQATPRDVEAGFGSIWVSNGQSGTVTRIDPVTNASLATIYFDDPPSVLAMSDDAVWVTSFAGVTVSRIDPVTNMVVGKVDPGGGGPVGIAFADGFVWVANHDSAPGTCCTTVAKIDPSKMKVVDQIPAGVDPDSGPSWIAFGAGSLWVGVTNIHSVVRIDPIHDTVLAKIQDDNVCGEIVATDKDVWVANGCGPGVTHIDPATNVVTNVKGAAGSGPALAIGAGSVWFGTGEGLDRIDTTSRKVVGQLKLPGASFGAVVGFGFIWVTDTQDDLLFKVKPA